MLKNSKTVLWDYGFDNGVLTLVNNDKNEFDNGWYCRSNS